LITACHGILYFPSLRFGGLWESVVKSFKHHFKRVIGELLFTFEELNTFTVEVKGILNSRPISYLSSNPNNILVLSSSHCFIGRPIIIVLCPSLIFRLSQPHAYPPGSISKVRHLKLGISQRVANSTEMMHKWKGNHRRLDRAHQGEKFPMHAIGFGQSPRNSFWPRYSAYRHYQNVCGNIQAIDEVLMSTSNRKIT